MFPIRTKFTLTLLLASFSAVLLMGAIAQHLVLERFNQLAMRRAFGNYRTDVRAFITEYGSWKRGQASEGFLHFVRRTRRPPGGGAPVPGPPGARPLPPFRFVLLAPDGTVLHAPGTYPTGSTLPAKLRTRKMPITVNGRVRAYAVPLGRANLSRLDLIYLAAIKRALLYSLLSVSAVTLVAGIYFGNRLSRSLRGLTRAVAAMEGGSLRQQVEVRTRDEIGALARSFNRMSKKLAVAYEKLEASHRTISEQAAKLKELSIRDDLTGLYNRRHFNERIEHLISQAKRYCHPLSVAICDIDDFKKINDKFSHHIGDEVIKRVARLIQAHIREADLTARLGGEEFVIAFPETRAGQAIPLCERLRKEIEGYSWSEIADGLRVTISIGLETDHQAQSRDQILIAADNKLYTAKDRGKNRLVA